MHRVFYVYTLDEIFVHFANIVFALISGQLFAFNVLSSDHQVTHADIYKLQIIYYKTFEFGTRRLLNFDKVVFSSLSFVADTVRIPV